MTARALVGAPGVLARVVLRAGFVWLLVRVALLLLGGNVPGAPGMVAIVGVCVALCMIDARVIGETLMVRNLGLPAWWLALVTGSVAALLDTALRLAL